MKNIQISGFQWDNGNYKKCQKHGVSILEIELLFAQEFAIAPDYAHSTTEYRFQAIGKTQLGRYLFVIFTMRPQGNEIFIRPISARYMHKKEVDCFEEKNSNI